MESAEILPEAPHSERSRSPANEASAELSLGGEGWELQNALDPPPFSPFSNVNSWGVIVLTVSRKTTELLEGITGEYDDYTK